VTIQFISKDCRRWRKALPLSFWSERRREPGIQK
jgi:hypothetical protein